MNCPSAVPQTLALSALIALLAVSGVVASATAGNVSIEDRQLRPGARTSITGRWLYKPGYALAAGEQPSDPKSSDSGYVEVPVPQMLSRVRWWLDDSEGFNAFEDRRLKALGFDTDRADDGWYRLWIDLKQSDIKGRRITIDFDGVAMKCHAYMNGHSLGEHEGMFSRFSFDITPHVHPGRNLLAVYVSMEKLDPKITPLGEAVTVNLSMSKIVSMSKGMFGPLSPAKDNREYDLHGIWQPVSLHVTSAGRIDDAWFIPKLDSAQVRVDVSGQAADAVLRAVWKDPKTGELLGKTKDVPVQLSGAAQTVTLSATGLSPKLWTPQEPNLYALEVSLIAKDGSVLDSWTHKVGFRTFEVQGNQLYLNGKPYWIRGANQLPYGKNPWNPELARKLIRLAHDGNTLFTRTHCTPWNEAWLDAADEIGLGVSIEGMRPWAFVGKIAPPPADMVAHWKMENADVIRRCRNHPSVLLWTVGNEMTLRDDENIEKWKILSDLVKQTRELDPTRPVICSSAYRRERKLYDAQLKPRGIDDGDLDDLHSYRGWYGTSPFVEDSAWIRKSCDYVGKRPIIGQEIATGYPNLDDGFPVLNYAKRLMVPQAWVGIDADPGGDPAAFLESHRAITKRMAEQLRFQRGDLTSGFMLFSSECWFANSYDPARIAPYPVYEAVKQAFAPIGLALQTPNRRFFSGQSFTTGIFVTNDDKDVAGPLEVRAEFTIGGQSKGGGKAPLAESKYYSTARVPISIAVPSVPDRTDCLLRVALTQNGHELSRTEDAVSLFPRVWAEAPLTALPNNYLRAIGVGPNLTSLIETPSVSSRGLPEPRVMLVARESIEREMPALRQFVANGGTAILLNAGEKARTLFPDCIERSREISGEFVETADTPAALTDGLKRFDIKWWGRNDDKAFVISATHNLKPGSAAKPLARHIVVHGYIDEAKKPEYITSPLVEIPAGKGRFVLCEFTLEDSVAFDPAARRFAANLLNWASKL